MEVNECQEHHTEILTYACDSLFFELYSGEMNIQRLRRDTFSQSTDGSSNMKKAGKSDIASYVMLSPSMHLSSLSSLTLP